PLRKFAFSAATVTRLTSCLLHLSIMVIRLPNEQFSLPLIQDAYPSGLCGRSSVWKSDIAFTFAASRLSATTEIRSNVACASSLGLVRKNSMVKFSTNLLSALRQAYHGNGRPKASSPRGTPGLVVVSSSEPRSLVIHAAHAAARRESRCFLLRMLGDRRLGGDHHTRGRRGVLEGRADDLGRIDNAERNEVAKFADLRIIAVPIFSGFEQLADPHRAVPAGIVDDLARRHLNRLANDVDAGLLIGILDLDRVEGRDGT